MSTVISPALNRIDVQFKENLQIEQVQSLLPRSSFTSSFHPKQKAFLASMVGCRMLLQICIIVQLDSRFSFNIATPKFSIPPYLQFKTIEWEQRLDRDDLLTGVHLFFESNQLFLNYEIDA
jgi:hypothetical protein